MEQTLLVAGIACVIAAVVGGGLKAFGIEIPALESGVRQGALGVLGLVLLGGAVAVGQGWGPFGGAGGSSPGPESTRPSSDGGTPSRTGDPSSGGDPESSAGETPPPNGDGAGDQAPPSDFPGGSTRAFAVDFTALPRPSTEHGRVSLGFGNTLVLEPSSNTWLGLGRGIEVAGVEGDFVCDARFRIEERGPNAALNWTLEETGPAADRVDVVVSVWGDDRATYTLTKDRVKTEGLAVPHVVTEAVVAERASLPADLRAHDWSTGSELTLKRSGGEMQFFVNDRHVDTFDVSLFPVGEMHLSAAFESKIVVTSIECRVRP